MQIVMRRISAYFVIFADNNQLRLMKKLILFLSALVLLAACEQPDSDRAILEPYAQEHMENPSSYEFGYMSMPHKYTYMEDLIVYMTGIQGLREKAADKAPYDAELEKVNELLSEVGNEVACYDRTLYYWYKGGDSGTLKLEGFVVGRFSADGRLIEATRNPDSLPTYPALQMLKDQGKL